MNRWGQLLRVLSSILLVLVAALAFRTSSAQSDTTSADVVQVNLEPLIEVAAKDRNRFAVDIPHVIDASHAGTWSLKGGIAIWRYSARIPTAVSLSFHVTNISLPPSARLSVQAAGSTYVYLEKDTNKHQLWSRISKGDSLVMELSVSPKERRDVVLQIGSFQAGYRGLGHAVPDHPYYMRLREQAMTGSTSSCIVNYECDVTAANTPPAQATVALIVGNTIQCSGTLINDVPQDGKPYVLTARHCETGKLGGGDPGAASSVVVYWDATSACGQPLGTLYDPDIVTQQGAATVAEQQDAWLLLLSEPPAANDAYFAGLDATAGVIQGGYTVHHALSNDKQLTTWNGDAVTATFAPNTSIAVPYTSDFWAVINLTGTIGPGASGSALIDQNNRVVGSLSLGNESGETADGYLACPLSPPPNPTPQNALAFFTSLAAVWTSTADPTGSGSTLQQALDPNNTATLVVDSKAVPATVRLTASAPLVSNIDFVSLTWSAPGATSCIASGGQAGDGWGGALPPSGSQGVAEPATTGNISYSITCTYPDGHTDGYQATVDWVLSDPLVNLLGPGEGWAGAALPLTWSTNDPPCVLAVGGTTQPLSGSSGTITVTQATPGKYDYHITCGSGAQTAVEDAFVTYVTPSVTFYPNTTDLRLGLGLELSWNSFANSCTTGGGMPNDGWSGNQFAGGGLFSISNAGLGTYTYTLNCVHDQVSVQASVTVTIEDNAPYATLSVSSNLIAMGQTVVASYKSNLAQCILEQGLVGTEAQGIFEVTHSGGGSEGTTTFTGGNVGASQLTLNCIASTPQISSAPQIVTVVQNVSASVSAPANAVTGTPFTLSWQTGAATSCTGSGGGADGTPWTVSVALPSGQQSITPTVAGSFTYTLTCVGQIPSDTTTAAATISVKAAQPSPPSGNGGGGSGGGGAFDELTLGLLGLATILKARWSRQPPRNGSGR